MMGQKKGGRSATIKRPFWRSDSLERIKVFLPELVLSTLSFTCLTATISTPDGSDPGAIFVLALIAQTLTQCAIYAWTYLTTNESLQFSGWLVFPFLITMITLPVVFIRSMGIVSEDVVLALYVTSYAGVILFYSTRVRGVFIFLLMEILSVYTTVDLHGFALVLQLLGIAALVALFVVRSSAARITVTYREDAATTEKDGRRPRLSSPVLAAIVAAAIVGLCLSTAVTSFGVVRRWQAAHGAPSPQASEQVTNEGLGEQNSYDAAGEAQGESADTTPQEGLGEQPTSQDATPASKPNDTSSALSSTIIGAIALAVLVALAVLPFSGRILRRWRVGRRSGNADRVARVYLATLGRLNAAEIERSEEETPREFLEGHEAELEGLTALAGFGIDSWETLTNTYEKARYAEEDITDAELEECLQLYRALPKCIRTTIGWRRYLLGPFWHM